MRKIMISYVRLCDVFRTTPKQKSKFNFLKTKTKLNLSYMYIYIEMFVSKF